MNGDIYCDQWCPLDDNDGDLFIQLGHKVKRMNVQSPVSD